MLKLKNKKLLGLISLILAIGFICPIAVHAAEEQFKSDQTLTQGMIVNKVKDDKAKVEASNVASADQVYGIAISVGDAPAPLSGEKQSITVANTGAYAVLVSNQNGPISAGDYVTLSDLAGVGMKADTNQNITIGKAIDKFDGQSGVVGQQDVRVGGKTKKVNLGYVTVNVAIGFNPLIKVSSTTNLSAVLRGTGTTIAQKPVSTARAYTAVIVFIAATIVTITVLYSGVRNAMVAVGRNPLSKKLIINALFKVIATSLIVFISGLGGVYLLLKL